MLATLNHAPVAQIRESVTRSVVRGPDDDRLLSQTGFFQVCNQFPCQMVDVTNHRLMLVDFALNLGIERRINHWSMRQCKRVVDEERFVLIVGDEIKNELIVDVRAELSLVGLTTSLGMNIRVPVSLAARFVS